MKGQGVLFRAGYAGALSLLTFLTAYRGGPPGLLSVASALVWTAVFFPPPKLQHFWALALVSTGLGAVGTYAWQKAWSPEAQLKGTAPLEAHPATTPSGARSQ